MPSEVRGSDFDKRVPPSLPSGLHPRVRKHANKLLKDNVHLWEESQIAPLVRLAALYADIEKASAELEETGLYLIDRFGVPKAHPLVQIRESSMRSALAIERQLGITFIARGANVKAAEKLVPAGQRQDDATQDDGRPPKLRLA